jgi:anaphase-promoting complex subunit 4
MFAATVHYSALEYEILQSEGYVSGPARKDMMANVLQRFNEGHVSIVHHHVFVETCDRCFY